LSVNFFLCDSFILFFGEAFLKASLLA